MKKKILIGVGVFVLLVLAGMYYLNNRNRTLSPPGEASIEANGISASISYSRPSVRGRVIFGTEEEDALQPYGQYWRLGANESTEITFEQNVNFAGNAVAKGTYKLYTFPGPDSFEFRLSNDIGNWGAMEPDYSKDLFSVMIPVEQNGSITEQFTLLLEPSDNGISLVVLWDTIRLSIPVSTAG